MEELYWFVAGGILGFVTNIISSAAFPSLMKNYKLWITRVRSKSHTITTPMPLTQKLTIGKLEVDWIILSTAQYTQDRMRFSYSNKNIPLIPEFAKMKSDFVSEIKRRETRGETHLPFNSPTYKLLSFNLGYREIIDGDEVPVLRLLFGPTDYFTQIITDLNVNNPVREKYAQATDITVSPVPEFSSILGININVITSDGYIIVTERSPNLPVGAGKLHTSLAEGLLRPTDSDAQGAPNPFRCALRAGQEELGIVLAPENIEFTAFGVHPQLCQYSLIGWTRINEKKEEIDNLWQLAVPKDKWENRRLLFIPCNPKTIAQFISDTRNNWFSIGLSAVILSLFQLQYEKKEIEAAFLSFRI